MIGNFFLAPVMAVGFMFFPFWYVILSASSYKKNVAAELESSIKRHYYRLSADGGHSDSDRGKYSVFESASPEGIQDFIVRINLVNPDIHEALKS